MGFIERSIAQTIEGVRWVAGRTVEGMIAVAKPFQPRVSQWILVGAGESTLSLDVGDILTEGATLALPININVSEGTVDMLIRHRTADLSFRLVGEGLGFSSGLGWSFPVTASYSGGEVFNMGSGIDLPSILPGTIITGPMAMGNPLNYRDFEGFVTLKTIKGSFGSNGIGGGVAIFSEVPILFPSQWPLVTAVGIVSGFHLVTGSVALEDSVMFFRVKIGASHISDGPAR